MAMFLQRGRELMESGYGLWTARMLPTRSRLACVAC